jgi:hypothetical protein
MRSSMSCFVVGAGAWARAVEAIRARRIDDAVAIRFLMCCYPSIIGLFGLGDAWVRSTVFVLRGFGAAGELFKRPVQSAESGAFEAVEGVHGSGFVGQAAECERLE